MGVGGGHRRALRARWIFMDSVSQPLNDLRTFRDSLYRCFERRADALFELTDTLFTAAGTVPSPVHLSLVPAHRRGWGSLYAALSRGHIEGGPLGELLARHASAGEPCPRLRRGRERLERLRRGDQPGAGILLPPLAALGLPAHRGR